MILAALSSDEKAGLIIGLITFVPLIIFLFTFVPISVYRSKREKWILEHSIAIRRLNEINKKYTQFCIPNIGLVHGYDNEKIYNDIKPKDYLTYQLVNNEQNLLAKVNEIRSNLKDYKEYIAEINSYCRLNHFDEISPYKDIEKIIIIEKALFKRTIKTQKRGFAANVTLKLITNNGVVVKTKSSHLNSSQIRILRERIADKNGDYYIHRDIWTSLCKVERGFVTNKMRFEIYERDKYRCCRCGTKDNLEIDHIIPISKGGKSTKDNLQTLCHYCNVRKGVQTVRYISKKSMKK